jgi:phospholipase D1/2
LERLAEPRENCWRLARAERLSFVIDAGPYFAALAEALPRAQRQVFIVGWDLDSRVRLTRSRSPVEQNETPDQLRPLLNRLVRQNPKLRVYLLCWDFALFYALEREWLPLYNLGWRTDRRVHFELDGEHPPGGCHHQKIVVIDDDMAFCGGIDLTLRRWDTPRHAINDARRVDPSGEPYGPFHDAQMALQGPAAAALGDLCRERWRVATGQRLRPTKQAIRESSDAWPATLEPDLLQTDVAIARTLPAFRGRAEVREVERLYCDLIASARTYIYIENQYLTSAAIRDALMHSLSRDHGPEIVIVGPCQASGWLESSTMDAIRAHVVESLRQSDTHRRLRLYYPSRRDSKGEALAVYVHDKLVIADDRWVRIGSANLSNRSMGLDSECDLLVDALDDERAGMAVRALRDRLLAEHLGREAHQVAGAIEQSGSLAGAIDQLATDGAARLEPLQPQSVEWAGELLSENPPFDPQRPMEPAEMVDELVPEEHQRLATRPVLFGALLLASLLGLAAAWRWTPLGSWLDPRQLAQWVEPLRGSLWAPVVALGSYVVAGLTLIPVTVLMVETAAVFGPVMGGLYSLAGLLLSATLAFAAGHVFGRRTVRRMAGSRLNRVSKRLGRGGILGVVLVRVLPVAPYTVVNLVAGASHVRFRHFVIGTVLGVTPGLVALSAIGDRLMAVLRNPSAASVIALAGVALFVLIGGAMLVRWLQRKRVDRPSASSSAGR